MIGGSLGIVSNREDWEQEINVKDEDGDAVTITDASIEIAVRKPSLDTAELTASVGSGITIATTSFTFAFTEAQMDNLCAGKYDVGMRIQLDGETKWTQLFIGTVSIVDGIVD